jgi:hypothetical protein
MRPRPETIRLGAHEWPVRPLTLRQVQEIEPILMSSAAETKGNVAAAMAIVAIALGRDHADAAAVLGDIEATAPEIGAAKTNNLFDYALRKGGLTPGVCFLPVLEKKASGPARRGNVAPKLEAPRRPKRPGICAGDDIHKRPDGALAWCHRNPASPFVNGLFVLSRDREVVPRGGRHPWPRIACLKPDSISSLISARELPR